MERNILQQAQQSAIESTLNSSIVSYQTVIMACIVKVPLTAGRDVQNT